VKKTLVAEEKAYKELHSFYMSFELGNQFWTTAVSSNALTARTNLASSLRLFRVVIRTISEFDFMIESHLLLSLLSSTFIIKAL
jgi:hypothetical protein